MPFIARLREALTRIFTSVKMLTAAAGMIVAFAARRGIVLDPGDVQSILVIVGMLLGAQGVADLGVRAAQITAATPPATQSQTVNVTEAKK